MKKLIIALITLGSIVSANAQPNINFNTLGAMFNDGSKPDLEAISNIPLSGRCFLKCDPKTPYNNGLFIAEQPAAKDYGPMAGQELIYKAFSYVHPNKGPAYFDNKSFQDVRKAISWVNAADEVRELSSAIEFGGKNNTFLTTIRGSGEYLVSESSDTKGIQARCYYFPAKLK